MDLLMHAWNGWHGHGGLWFPGLFFPLFWIVVIALLLWRRPWRRWNEHRSGISVLDERYARGEIDRQEYEERRRVLEGR